MSTLVSAFILTIVEKEQSGGMTRKADLQACLKGFSSRKLFNEVLARASAALKDGFNFELVEHTRTPWDGSEAQPSQAAAASKVYFVKDLNRTRDVLALFPLEHPPSAKRGFILTVASLIFLNKGVILEGARDDAAALTDSLEELLRHLRRLGVEKQHAALGIVDALLRDLIRAG
jgi:hypothetical protein